jgi:predicted transcriptional regulator
MKRKEAQLLNAIANGVHTLEAIGLTLEEKPNQLGNLLQSLLAQKLLVANNHSFLISKKGLLELSRFLFFQTRKKAEYSYSYNNRLPIHTIHK